MKRQFLITLLLVIFILTGCSDIEQVENRKPISKDPVVRNTSEETIQREEMSAEKETDVVEDRGNMEESTPQEDNEEVSYEEANTEQDIPLTPDKRIEMLGASKEYQEGDVQAKAKLCEELLEQMKAEGIVTEYTIRLDVVPAIIDISYAEGIVGGYAAIFLEDFPEDFN